jgi:hypothetical protein
MNRSRVTFIIASCFLSVGPLIVPPLAKAQFDAHISRVKIPFTFQAEDEVLPAGTYRLENRLNHLVLLIGPNNRSVSVLVHDAVSLQFHQTGTVVFYRYGETYFLKQIWYRDDSSGLECYISPAEKSMLRASNNEPPSVVSLALTYHRNGIDRQ